MPTTKKPTTEATLMDQVIAALEKHGRLPAERMLDAPRDAPRPAPVDNALREALTLADGAALPPSLRRWFAYDGAWPRPAGGDLRRRARGPERPGVRTPASRALESS